MRFDFLPLRFEFIAREPLSFTAGKAGNILRGALGTIFRNMACSPGCKDARTCTQRGTCLYARTFVPLSDGVGPSGLADSPRPFVFRARHLDGQTIETGATFHFDLHVFSLDPDLVRYFIDTFAALAVEGLGPRRVKADLLRVTRIGVGDIIEQPIAGSLTPVSVDLDELASAPKRIRVEFLSPTELKHEHRVIDQPEFPIFYGRIRDRVSTLRALYGKGPLQIDFAASGVRARNVCMTRCEGGRAEAERRSSRTGQTHSIGGFTGFADYEGDLAEFLPYLEAGRWTGVGRHSVWGNGEFSIQTLMV